MVTLTIAKQNAAALCRLVDKLAVHILRSALDRLAGRLGLGKRVARRSDSLKIPKRADDGNSTFEGL
jgi:hypothetical protein